MAREQFNDLLWFLAVAEERSFTRAAARLGISQSTLSHTIKRLETQMGLRLLHRTTRNVAPTEAGERLQATLAPRFAEIEAEMAALTDFRDKTAGRIRMTLSDHALNSVVWPKLRPVMASYPDIRLELHVQNGFSNIVQEGFDAGIRLGESIEADMVAVRVGPDWRLVAVASPAYLAAHGRPEHPKELLAHNCINYRYTPRGGQYAWEFAQGEEDLRVRVEGQLTFNGADKMVDAAVAGLGIAYVPEDTVTGALASGALEQVLDEWSPHFPGYYIYYPSRHQNLPAFRVILDALRHRPGG
ncbi:MAG: LysR family transcriptional regulator [Proteobacteria bacterium]|nr:LysR family transcriptional regulator [Pseudomonadota bacterium]